MYTNMQQTARPMQQAITTTTYYTMTTILTSFRKEKHSSNYNRQETMAATETRLSFSPFSGRFRAMKDLRRGRGEAAKRALEEKKHVNHHHAEPTTAESTTGRQSSGWTECPSTPLSMYGPPPPRISTHDDDPSQPQPSLTVPPPLPSQWHCDSPISLTSQKSQLSSSTGSSTGSRPHRRISRTMVPLVIRCGNTAHGDGENSPLGISTTVTTPTTVQEDFRYQGFSIFCLDLLESPSFDDNRLGIERLVVLVNDELVNSILHGGIAEMLVFGTSSLKDNGAIDDNHNNNNDDNNNNNHDDVAERLRSVFPTYLCSPTGTNHDDDIDRSISSRDNSTVDDHKKNLEESHSTEDTSLYGGGSDLSASSTGQHRRMLMLPALRILVSSLQLASRGRSGYTLDFTSTTANFWKTILDGITECLEERDAQCVESALAVKAVRMLHALDPKTMEPFVRYTLLPFLSNAKEHGQQRVGGKMLIRECQALLEILQ